MATPAKINFRIYQGSTFGEVLRWETPTKVYKNITAITQAAPVVITTSTPHGMPTGWRAKLTNILGMTELNSSETYYNITNLTSTTFSINAINAVGYKPYISGGIVEYNDPVNIEGFTARMQVRPNITSTVVLADLSTANGGIVMDNTEKTITLNISDSVTAGFEFNTAVYSLEIISPDGQVTPFCGGTLTLYREVTR